MELRHYLAIVWRRAWIVALVFGLTVAVSLLLLVNTPPSTPTTSATSTTVVAVRPVLEYGSSAHDAYYAYQATDLHVEDLVRILESPRFRESLRAQLPELDSEVDASQFVVQKTRSTLAITITSPSSPAALALSELTVAALTTEGTEVQRYLASVAPLGLRAAVVFSPSVQVSVTSRSSARPLLDLVLRGLLALLAGLALAFLIDYLDDTFRAREDVERELGLPVFGEVPAGRDIPARAGRA